MANLDNLMMECSQKLESNMERNIRSYKENIKAERGKKRKLLRDLGRRVETVKLLVALDVIEPELALKCSTEYGTWDNGNNINVTGKLHILRTAYGSDFVELDETTKEEHDASKNEIKIRIKQKKGFVGPRMYVVQTLPADAKCKFVTHTSTYTSLTCDR